MSLPRKGSGQSGVTSGIPSQPSSRPRHRPARSRRRIALALATAAAVVLGGTVAGLASGAQSSAPHPARPGPGTGSAVSARQGNGSPSDGNISFIGRWNTGSTSASYPQWSGAYLQTAFTGTSLRLSQRGQVTGYASIDGGGFTRFAGHGTIDLTPRPLSPGTHSVKVVYDSGDAVFRHLRFAPGAGTVPPHLSPRLVEFVGDSITAGYGTSKGAVTSAGFLLGERLGVRHTEIARTGYCLVAHGPCAGLRDRFFALGSDGGTPWDFTRYRADTVVINVGTNDAVHGVPGPEFQSAYTGFLAAVRAKYPKSAIVVLETLKRVYPTETRAAVRARKAAGDTNVRFVSTEGWLTGKGQYSDGMHPNDAGQAAIADHLARVVAPLIGVPAGHTQPAAGRGAAPDPAVHIFYYPWYGGSRSTPAYRHWVQGGHTPPKDIGSNFYPTLGPYDSSDATAVIPQHMRWIRSSGAGVLVYSWWGRGSREDSLAARVLSAAAAQGLKVAWHIEPYQGRTAESTVRDIQYINTTYGSSPAFYRDAQHGKRGAFYVFQSPRIPDWTPLERVKSTSIVLAQTTSAPAMKHFGGAYTYDGIAGATAPGWKQAADYCRAHHLVWAPSVAPGYIDRRASGSHTTPIVDRAAGAVYDKEWGNALHTATGGWPDWVSITSFNEWHEGSVIEPAAATPPAGHGYLTFNGAYGHNGAAAETVYLDRTRQWVTQFEHHSSAPPGGNPK